MNNKYVLLNKEFCEANQNAENSTGKFGFAVTTDGRYVASSQTISDFPELFQGELPFPGLIIIELDVTDFPNTSTFP